ncbi:ATP-binding protein [Streptomyces sp. NPDC048416]|uniref:ATP-binding protein n=1 Tax=Streptomyces sp. NPDC048416 TaxID=3365546 RepID=UPI00371AF7AC
MPTLITRFAIAGVEEDVSPARRKVVESARTWGLPLDAETTDAIRLVASELISNAVIHGAGPITVVLYHGAGKLVIVVSDRDQTAPVASCPGAGDENGRGLTLVAHFALDFGWELLTHGKRVWAEIELPKPPPAIRAAVLRRSFALRSGCEAGPTIQPLALAAV